MINVNFNHNGTNKQHMPPNVVHQEEHSLISMIFLPKVHNLNLIMRKHQTNPNLKDTLQNPCPVLFKNICFIKYKEHLGTSTLKESKKI